MAQRRSRDQRVVRNRRVAIYTFLLILTLFYISAHRTVQKQREMDARKQEVVIRQEQSMPAGHGGEAAGMMAEDAGDAWNGGTGGEDEQGGGGTSWPEDRAGELTITQEDLWCLILTNAEYPVPEDYTVELEMIPGTEQSVDKRIYEPLMAMVGDMKAQGLSPVVCSGYRTLDKQEKLFNRKVQSYVRSGHTKEESYELARQTISIPGSGEHCLGLAVDFYTRKYHKLEREFENTPESEWLMEHAQDYGFIMRYGENKVDITGIQYEPWHYRYVGVEAAKYIKEHGLSLEEFYIEQSLYG